MAEVDFDDLDYSKMIVNPRSLKKSQDPLEMFDIYKQHVEFFIDDEKLGVDRRILLRYIPYVYDQNSPLHHHIENIKILKAKAAELAGFKKLESGVFMENVMHILDCRNRYANFMIVRYITLHKSKMYHRFVILSEVYEGLSVRMLQDQDIKDIKSFEDIGNQLDSIKQELLSNDSNQQLSDDFHEYYFEDKLRLRPEDIARLIAEDKIKRSQIG